jgi:hypothetical protein
MVDKELIEKVKTSLLEHTKQRRSKIPLNVGELIVVGYSYKENETIGDYEYIAIGEYDGGELDYGVNLKNEVVLSHKTSCKDRVIKDTPYIGDKECYGDAFSFWRVPSDDEIKLYQKIQNIEYYVDKFDKYIWEYTDKDDIDMEKVMQTLQSFVTRYKKK